MRLFLIIPWCVLFMVWEQVFKKGVRKLLDKNKYVKSYQDGGPNEGGLGATLVYFE